MTLKDSKQNKNVLKRTFGFGVTPEMLAKANLARLKEARTEQAKAIQCIVEDYLDGGFDKKKALEFTRQPIEVWNSRIISIGR